METREPIIISSGNSASDSTRHLWLEKRWRYSHSPTSLTHWHTNGSLTGKEYHLRGREHGLVATDQLP